MLRARHTRAPPDSLPPQCCRTRSCPPADAGSGGGPLNQRPPASGTCRPETGRPPAPAPTRAAPRPPKLSAHLPAAATVAAQARQPRFSSSDPRRPRHCAWAAARGAARAQRRAGRMRAISRRVTKQGWAKGRGGGGRGGWTLAERASCFPVSSPLPSTASSACRRGPAGAPSCLHRWAAAPSTRPGCSRRRRRLPPATSQCQTRGQLALSFRSQLRGRFATRAKAHSPQLSRTAP